MARAFKSIMVVLLMSCCCFAQTKIFFVNGDYEGENYDGTSWLSAFPTLQEAIDAAALNDGGEIWVKSGVYCPPADLGREATYSLAPGIQLYGGFRGDEEERFERSWTINRTILSGDIGRRGSRTDNCYHVITATDDCIIDGFIISNGMADGSGKNSRGAGMYLPSGTSALITKSCSFEKNQAVEAGGAIYCTNASVAVRSCTFYSNSAKSGGAIHLYGTSEAEVLDSTFSSNFAGEQGGAIALLSGAGAIVRRSAFQLNTSGREGGAVYSFTDTAGSHALGLTECSFRQNTGQLNGGAIFNQGPFAATVIKGKFLRNVSQSGTAGIANVNRVVLNISGSSYHGNRGAQGLADITADETSTIGDASDNPYDASLALLRAAIKIPKSDSTEEEKVKEEEELEDNRRKLPDLFVYNQGGTKVKLKSVVGANDFTVVATGCLTSPCFINCYQKMETARADFTEKGIGFFYIYRFLKHPENNGFVTPFYLRERQQHIAIAQKQLRTKIPWLCDQMGNEAAEWLESEKDSLFIFNASGEEIYSGKLEYQELRSELNKLVGEPGSKGMSRPKPILSPLDVKEPEYMKKVVVRRDQKLKTLQVSPVESKAPFYVKLRAEAEEELIKTGRGKMYLGFHIDPIYVGSEWNNLDDTLSYAISVPQGTVVSPSIDSANKNPRSPTDTDPREFMVEARKWQASQPLTIAVKYTIHSSKRNWTRNIKQQYIVYLDEDKYGGTVFGRQADIPNKKAITFKKRKPKPKKTSFDKYLGKYDINRDGKLSVDEVSTEVRESWEAADANKDGVFDAEEHDSYFQ